jgi:predicted metal-binding protein
MSKASDKKIPKRIDPFRSDEICRADLERYCLMAIELGASDAKVIKSNQVIVENRVRGKCLIPQCPHYGESVNCPPYTPLPEEMRMMIKEYKHGIFVRMIIPADQIAGEKAAEENRLAPYRRKINEVVSKIESQAFYDGYPLAMGFVAGSCKKAFCPDIECSALVQGKGCRHPLWARPSMESVGMNVYMMAAKIGWDIYPIGKKVSLDDLPHGNYFGLILIY